MLKHKLIETYSEDVFNTELNEFLCMIRRESFKEIRFSTQISLNNNIHYSCLIIYWE